MDGVDREHGFGIERDPEPQSVWVLLVDGRGDHSRSQLGAHSLSEFVNESVHFLAIDLFAKAVSPRTVKGDEEEESRQRAERQEIKHKVPDLIPLAFRM